MHLLKWTRYSWKSFGSIKKYRKSRVPHNITLAKGEAHIAVSRAFVDFVLHNRKAADFLTWVSDTRNPDEFYFQSLNSSPHLHVPGSYPGN